MLEEFELCTNLNVETNEESSSNLSQVNMAEITQTATEIRSRNQALSTCGGVRLGAGRKSFLNGSVIGCLHPLKRIYPLPSHHMNMFNENCITFLANLYKKLSVKFQSEEGY
uniref:Uncharacterized protein n=1 Tax=Romanomermis culicivorax TaxID=13658 RepID=A0A915ICB6_ROMCU